MVIICHVISKDHLIKLLIDFTGRSPSKQVTILQSFVTIAAPLVEL